MGTIFGTIYVSVGLRLFTIGSLSGYFWGDSHGFASAGISAILSPKNNNLSLNAVSVCS